MAEFQRWGAPPDPKLVEEAKPITWGDWGQALISTGAQTAGMVGSAARMAGEEASIAAEDAARADDPLRSQPQPVYPDGPPEGVIEEPREPASPGAELTVAFGKMLTDATAPVQEEAVEDMSPAAQKLFLSTISSPEFHERMLGAMGLKLLGNVGPTAAAIAIGAATPAGALGATIVTAGVSSGMSVADLVDSFYGITDQYSDQQLYKEAESFRNNIDAGMDPAMARRRFDKEIRGNRPYYAALFGAALGAAGPAGQVVRATKASTTGFTGGITKRVLKGAGVGAITEFPEEGYNAYATQEGEIDVGLRDKWDYRGMGDQALEGAFIGAGYGTAGGAVSKRRAPPEDEPPAPAATNEVTGTTSPPAPPPQDAPIGNPKSAPKGSARDYPAKKQKKAKGSKAPLVDTGVAPDHAAALAAAKPTPIPPEVAAASESLPAVPALAPTPSPDVYEPTAQTTPTQQVAANEVTFTGGPAFEGMNATLPPTVAPSEVTPGVSATPRILPDQTVKAKPQLTPKQAAANLKAAEPKVVKEGHRTKKELAQREEDAATSQNLMDRYAPAENESDEQVLARATTIVDEATVSGVKIPGNTRTAAGKEHPAPVVLAMEARALVRAAKRRKKSGLAEALTRFRANEAALRAGDVAEVVSSRKVEGEVAKRGVQKAVETIAARSEADEDTDTDATSAPTEDEDASVPSGFKPEADDKAASVTASKRGANISARTETAKVKMAGGKEQELERAQAASGELLADKPDEKARLTAEMNAKLAAEFPKAPEKKAEPAAPKQTPAKKAVAKKPTKAQVISKQVSKQSGLPIRVQVPRGDVRTGTAPDGTKWEQPMQHHYGEVARSQGTDGDPVDIIVGPSPEKHKTVYVIDQVNADTKEFDEHKTLTGFADAKAVTDAYESMFSDGRAGDRFGGIEVMSQDEFKAWLEDGITQEPLTPEVSELVAEPVVSVKGSFARNRELLEELMEEGSDPAAKRSDETFFEYLNRIAISKGTVAEPFSHSLSQQLWNGELRDGFAAWARTKGYASNNIITKLMFNRVAQLAGDVPVYVVPDGALPSLNMLPSHGGGYFSAAHVIIVPEHSLNSPSLAHTVVHEAAHAAFLRATALRPDLVKMVDRIAREAKAAGIADQYAFTNVDEFIAEAFSNANFISALARVKASPGMALGLAQHSKEFLGRDVKTLWDALLTVIGKALGLQGGAQYTLLDGMMHVGAELESQLAVTPPGPIRDRAAVTVPREVLSQKPGSPWRQVYKDGQLVEGLDAAPDIDPLDKGELIELAGDHGGALADRARKLAVQFMTLDQIRQKFAGTVFGGSLKKLVDAIAAQQPVMVKFRESYDHLASEFQDYTKAKAAEAREFADIAITLANIDGWVIEGEHGATIVAHEKNAHLGKDKTHGWQAKARLPDLQRRYNAMSPEGRALFQKMAQFYRDTHNNIVRESVKAILNEEVIGTKLSSADLKAVTHRVMQGQLNDADETLLGGTIFHALKKATEFRAIKGAYFPRMRYGDHVVTTVDKIKNAMGGIIENDDTVVFKDKSEGAARKAARDFVRGSELIHLATSHVYYNALTGEEVSADAATALNDVEHGFKVQMQTKGTYFFESRAAAHKFARENPEGHDTVSKPQDRLGEGYHAHIMTGTQMATILNSIEARQDVNPATRHLMRTVLTQASARMLSGNRIQSRRLKSRKVTGASTDFARNILNYGSAAGRHIATAQSMPIVRTAMAEMRDQMNNYEGKDKNALVQVYNEVALRVDQGTIEPNAPSKIMRDVLLVSQFTRLGSIGYSVINGTQVMLVTAPVLAGRFKAGRAYNAIRQAYADMGFADTLISGVFNTARATHQWNKAGLTSLDDLMGNVQKKLAKASDGEDVLKMIDVLIEGNAISTTAGFETSEAVAEGRGAAGQVIFKTDRILRQLPAAVEIVNRTVSGVAAYRLARKSGMNHDKATQFAFDTVKNTQGDYTAANAPRFFNNPYLRPAMQFRKYAQLYTYVVADMAHRAFADASLAERKVARRQLAHVFATQIAIAGALSLPGLELVKAGFMISAALGLTGGWDDQEELIKSTVESSIGKTWGQMVTSGVISRAVGIDVSQRLSASDLWGVTWKEPTPGDPESVEAYMFRQIAGSSGAMVLDWRTGMELTVQGEWAKGLEKILPLKTAGDFVKAANRQGAGRQNTAETILNTIGLRSAQQAETGREVGASIRRSEEQQREGKRLSKAYQSAQTKGERVKLRFQIKKYNATVSFRYHVNPDTLDKYRAR